MAVLGHIDHGKSTLLDYIRKSNTVEKEVGGITQHLSAYEAEVGPDKRKITFLDTPGHEAFCAIRERGSRVADIAILVVSAEDGVKPQTIEAIKCICAEATPFIVAINKIDKPNANIEKTKQDLAGQEVFVEGWGGTVPVVNISAKKGDGVAELLEMILLQADLLELESDPLAPAEGFVIESAKDTKNGVSATLIIKNGQLKKGTYVASQGGFVAVRQIETFDGQKIDRAEASMPIRLTGWNGLPIVGEDFASFDSKSEAEEYVSQLATKTETQKIFGQNEAGCSCLPIIIKADAQGSLEAIENEFNKINISGINLKIIADGIGPITEGDVKTAVSSKAVMIGFNVPTDKNANALGLRDAVEIRNFSIIYELTDWLKEKLQELAPKEKQEVITAKVKILKVFSQSKDKQVIGCRAEDGEVKSGQVARIFRREGQIGEGRIRELQSQKQKVGSIEQGQEFGMLFESKTEVAPGDYLEIVSLS